MKATLKKHAFKGLDVSLFIFFLSFICIMIELGIVLTEGRLFPSWMRTLEFSVIIVAFAVSMMCLWLWPKKRKNDPTLGA